MFFKKDHVDMRLWTRLYGTAAPFTVTMPSWLLLWNMSFLVYCYGNHKFKQNTHPDIPIVDDVYMWCYLYGGQCEAFVVLLLRFIIKKFLLNYVIISSPIHYQSDQIPLRFLHFWIQ